MRTVCGGVSVAGLVGAAAAGAYLGAAAAGLLAVLSGQVFAAGSPWPAGAGVLAILGAAGGWLVSRFTRVVPTLQRRAWVLSVGGLVSVPLAVALGQLHQGGSVGVGLVMIAGLATAVTHVRTCRRRAAGRYAHVLR